jgi:hypothetical protein
MKKRVSERFSDRLPTGPYSYHACCISVVAVVPSAARALSVVAGVVELVAVTIRFVGSVEKWSVDVDATLVIVTLVGR